MFDQMCEDERGAQDLLRLGVIDEIIPAPEAGAHRDYDLAATNLGTALRQNLERIDKMPVEDLLKKRYKKFRGLGKFAKGKSATSSNHS